MKPAALFQPTVEQAAALSAPDRYAIVQARAGTGKTTLLALCIQQALAAGAAPTQILALAYTEEAVRALRSHLQRLRVAAKQIDALGLCTVDAFCARVLYQLQHKAVENLASAEDAKPWVLSAMRQVRDQSRPEDFDLWPEPDSATAAGMVEGVLQDFRRLKGRMTWGRDWPVPLTPDSAEALGYSYTTLRLLARFEHLRHEGHGDPFEAPIFRTAGDATAELAQLLDNEPDLLTHTAPFDGSLTHLLLDEMHDTNAAMDAVLQGLRAANPGLRFLGVGDKLQLIHGDQSGADAAYLAEGRARALGQSTRLGLTLSHRFGPELARLATALTGEACTSADRWPTAVQWMPCQGLDAMAEASRCAIERAMDTDAQRKPKAHAVLVRHGYQTVPFETQFLRHGLPYQLPTGLTSYLRRDEVLLLRGLYAYAHDAFDQVPPDGLQPMLRALLRWSGARVDSAEQMGATQAQRDRLAAAKGTVVARVFVEEHVMRSAAPWALKKLEAALAVLRIDSIPHMQQSLLTALEAPALLERVLVGHQAQRNALHCMRAFLHEARACNSLGEFFADQNALDKLAGQTDWRDGGLTLSTFALAKGREYEHVFLAVVAEPGQPMLLEQNLLYVALTRAKHSLHILHDATASAPLLKKMHPAM